MKKKKPGKLALLLCLLLCCVFFAGSVRASGGESGPQISAGAAEAVDLDSGEILYEKNSGETYAPADLTKIMTVLLLVENYDLSEKVSFSEILYQTGESGTRLGLQPGEEISLYDAACAIWLGNADDVVNGVAEYAAGSREAFAELMNRRAQELGCQNTSFSDPNGDDSENQYTCASDLIRILQAGYQNTAFREISRLAEYEISATNLTDASRYLQISQQMLLTDSGSGQEYLVGGMETATSGETVHLAEFYSSGSRNLAVILLGAADAQTAAAEAVQLADYGFSSDTAAGSGDAAVPLTEDEEVLVLTEEAAVQDSGEVPAQETQSGQDGAGLQNTENGLADTVKNWFASILTAGSDLLHDLLDYAADHQMQTVALIDGVLAGVLLLLLIIALVRNARNAKIRRRRKRERRQRRIREAQIEQMKVEELEREIDRDRTKETRRTKDRLK